MASEAQDFAGAQADGDVFERAGAAKDLGNFLKLDGACDRPSLLLQKRWLL
ncbi:hypothetical protein HFO17_21515 [Rhizobium laguerreae]|uniref:hypothetical protein n=1 Tax=Rhizobium laguerreae TaxID=1076926 RepID=UPI001C927E92|nr:hypothetical protein [Rhizobium laguerreae]MBY3223481.1 hypothetical protein [Rhizobium laguerreae]MBY3237086.1 hypothetical protein [Rhizobium laguerreae]